MEYIVAEVVAGIAAYVHAEGQGRRIETYTPAQVAVREMRKRTHVLP